MRLKVESSAHQTDKINDKKNPIDIPSLSLKEHNYKCVLFHSLSVGSVLGSVVPFVSRPQSIQIMDYFPCSNGLLPL